MRTFEQALKILIEKEPEKFRRCGTLGIVVVRTNRLVLFSHGSQDDIDEILAEIGWEYCHRWKLDRAGNLQWTADIRCMAEHGWSGTGKWFQTKPEGARAALIAVEGARAALIAVVDKLWPEGK